MCGRRDNPGEVSRCFHQQALLPSARGSPRLASFRDLPHITLLCRRLQSDLVQQHLDLTRVLPKATRSVDTLLPIINELQLRYAFPRLRLEDAATVALDETGADSERLASRVTGLLKEYTALDGVRDVLTCSLFNHIGRQATWDTALRMAQVREE